MHRLNFTHSLLPMFVTLGLIKYTSRAYLRQCPHVTPVYFKDLVSSVQFIGTCVANV